MRPLVLLRPEPGLSRSAARARGLGLEVIKAPLFAIEPVAWCCPDPNSFDALLLTSANAARFGGPCLAKLASIPVHAVGAATADAARAVGLSVASIGELGVDALLEALPPKVRLLHLCGEDFYQPSAARHSIAHCPVYQAVALASPELPDLTNTVVAVHSARAGARLAELCEVRNQVAVVAISAAAASACGAGWRAVRVAESPDDTVLLALAARLCQISGQ